MCGEARKSGRRILMAEDREPHRVISNTVLSIYIGLLCAAVAALYYFI